jgi:beta-xylosidase
MRLCRRAVRDDGGGPALPGSFVGITCNDMSGQCIPAVFDYFD